MRVYFATLGELEVDACKNAMAGFESVVSQANTVRIMPLNSERPLDSRTRATYGIRFDLNFFHVFLKCMHPQPVFLFFTRKVSTIMLVDGGKDLS